MEEFFKFLRCVFSAILYGATIANLTLFIVRFEGRNILYAVVCLVLALLIDILNELKKFNDKNK